MSESDERDAAIAISTLNGEVAPPTISAVRIARCAIRGCARQSVADRMIPCANRQKEVHIDCCKQLVLEKNGYDVDKLNEDNVACTKSALKP